MQYRVRRFKHQGHNNWSKNLNCFPLPETFSIRDKQIGVWWVTVTADGGRNLHRARIIPGAWEENPHSMYTRKPWTDCSLVETQRFYNHSLVIWKTKTSWLCLLLYPKKDVAMLSLVPGCSTAILVPAYICLHKLNGAFRQNAKMSPQKPLGNSLETPWFQ